MNENDLNALIQIAKIDGELTEQEIHFIHKVGVANQLTQDQINRSIKASVAPVLENLTDDQKYDLIYALVQIMKVDGKLHKEEVNYCAKIASNLGYDESVLLDLLLNVQSNDGRSTKQNIKHQIQQHLNH